jgi:hypothetical protein
MIASYTSGYAGLSNAINAMNMGTLGPNAMLKKDTNTA